MQFEVRVKVILGLPIYRESAPFCLIRLFYTLCKPKKNKSIYPRDGDHFVKVLKDWLKIIILGRYSGLLFSLKLDCVKLD